MALKLKKSAIIKVHKEASQAKKYTLLIVDDEENNLSSISRILSALYNIITAQDGKEALELIRKDENPHRIQLILSDQRMPRMTGVEFLKQTIHIIPKAIRMILTGFMDIDATIGAINDGQVYKYLTKPIDPQYLLITIKRALEAYELEHQNHLLIEELKALNSSLEQKVEERTFQLQQANQKLERLSQIDGLTKIYNRRYFDIHLDMMWREHMRNGLPLSIIMLDIDYFKKYNDTYGHQAGDECLCTVTRAIEGSLHRSSDFLARYGGEEFVVITKDDINGSQMLAEKLRHAVEALYLEHSKSSMEFVTISLGVASIIPTKISALTDLIKIADKALYDSKNRGRNRVSIGKFVDI